MKILILGSEGFIGSNALNYFTEKGYEVLGADIVLKRDDNYIIINPEAPDFSSIFIKHDFDICINATGSANVQLSYDNPSLDFSLNCGNVYSILDAIRLHNPKCRFINLSSAAVYGNPVSLPISEEASANPLSPYGFHKLYSEQICKEFNVIYGIGTLSLRIFSAFGEGLKKQLFWDLNKKMTHDNGDVKMFGSGQETRDFIYIKDLLSALNCIIINAEFKGQCINIASGTEISIKEAVRLYLKVAKYNGNIIFEGTEKIGDPINWRADISILKGYGFETEYSLENGLINYFKWVTERKLL
ncbi:NAD-dependent epimerase/dehydratase family protein [Flavihumibacter sediminis]|nr:NAD-dependent epimerase/dehydratase family protein [Flavihumibacter sediminis]